MFQNLLAPFLSFWYVWLFLAIVWLGKLYFAYRRQARLAESGISEIDIMDGRTFEEYLEGLFHRLGYAVELTPYQGDWGGDLVLTKSSVKTVVQAKRYSKKVGVRAVQEVVAAKAKYGCVEAMVVTSSNYTKQAQELAQANRVVLWDRDRLVEAILSAKPKATTESSTAASVTTKLEELEAVPPVVSDAQGEPELAPLRATATIPVCHLCHKPVSDKVARFCLSNAKHFEGRIYCFEHQKRPGVSKSG